MIRMRNTPDRTQVAAFPEREVTRASRHRSV